jgi:hypothetical protein
VELFANAILVSIGIPTLNSVNVINISIQIMVFAFAMLDLSWTAKRILASVLPTNKFYLELAIVIQDSTETMPLDLVYAQNSRKTSMAPASAKLPSFPWEMTLALVHHTKWL